MPQLILVLEENLEIQGVISSSLKDSDVTIVNESNSEFFDGKLKDLEPDLIFLSNTDSDQDYKICKYIRNNTSLKDVPIILLLNAKDHFDDFLISELGINGTLRKPFEASMLREQLSQFIVLDENFGNGPKEDENDFKIDMKDIDDQLKEIKDPEPHSEKLIDGINKSLEKRESGEKTNLEVLEMDSMMLENFSNSSKDQKIIINNTEEEKQEIQLRDSAPSQSGENIDIDANTLDKKEAEVDLDSGFEFDLKLDENEEKKSPSDGLENLKNSGLEEQFAENILNNQKEETLPELRNNLKDIELDVNDFEEETETWERPDNLDLYHQTPRAGLTDIRLEESDFNAEFPKNLSSFGDTSDLSISKLDEMNKDASKILDGMDNIELEEDLMENLEGINGQDNLILTDSDISEDQTIKKSGDDKELESFSTNEDLFDSGDDTEIKSMVKDSFKIQEEIKETSLDDLEELSVQMAELESEAEELESEEKELESEAEELESEEKELESEEKELESAEEELESEEEVFESEEEVFESEEEALGSEGEEIEVADLGLEIDDLGLEIDDLGPESEAEVLESEEKELESEEKELESEEKELESEEKVLESEAEVLESEEKVLESEDPNFERKESLELDEDVFQTWDEAENAFMNFERESSLRNGISESLEDDRRFFEKEDTYSFSEEELKEIVTNSVQKALEKSIASSLVELAISELKTKVSEMDQDWV